VNDNLGVPNQSLELRCGCDSVKAAAAILFRKKIVMITFATDVAIDPERQNNHIGSLQAMWWLVSRRLTPQRSHFCCGLGDEVTATGFLEHTEDHTTPQTWRWSHPSKIAFHKRQHFPQKTEGRMGMEYRKARVTDSCGSDCCGLFSNRVVC
jgi:hypothetical protein